MFDEWAAMARHLDEVNKEVDIREKQLTKERQNIYKQELEKQRKEIQERAAASKNVVSEFEKKAVQDQVDRLREIAAKESMKGKLKKKIEMSIMNENINIKRKNVEENKQVELYENSVMMNELKRLETEEKVKTRTEKVNKDEMANALKEAYVVQQSMKQQEKEKLKQLDKVYCEKYKEKLIEDDKDRQRVILLLLSSINIERQNSSLTC